MNELTEGIWTNAQLAKWFGITEQSFKNSKKKKLRDLKYFAEFHEKKGKVIIDKVLNPYYSQLIAVNYKKVRDKVNEVWSENGLDTCKRVGTKIYVLLTESDEDFNLKDSTVINYTLKGRNELYGKPFTSGGRIGSCIYLLCKKDDEGNFSFFTEEEEKIKKKIQTKYFGDTTEKQILVQGMIEDGEITEEEAWGVLQEMTGMNKCTYNSFIWELSEAIGYQVIKGTFVERGAYDTSGGNRLEVNVVDGDIIKEENVA